MKIKAIFCVGAVSLLAFLPVSQAAQPGEALAAAAPHATLHLLHGCGHDPMHETPDRLRALVAAMVRVPATEPGAPA